MKNTGKAIEQKKPGVLDYYSTVIAAILVKSCNIIVEKGNRKKHQSYFFNLDS